MPSATPSPPPPPSTTYLHAALRAHVTAASPDYVGSVTLSASLCAAAGLFHRQLVQIRVERSAVELWTYVILAPSPAPSVHVCVNGAAALHVRPRDVVCICAYARAPCPVPHPPLCDLVDLPLRLPSAPVRPHHPCHVTVDIAVAKIHRPRVTRVVHAPVPAVLVDADWIDRAAMTDGQQVHVVNVSNGQRDVLVLRPAPRGTAACELHMFGRPLRSDPGGFGDRSGYAEGDIIIIMAYCAVTINRLAEGLDLPKMNTCFPCEIPQEERDNCIQLLEGPHS